jgi:hypothetical protein
MQQFTRFIWRKWALQKNKSIIHRFAVSDELLSCSVNVVFYLERFTGSVYWFYKAGSLWNTWGTLSIQCCIGFTETKKREDSFVWLSVAFARFSPNKHLKCYFKSQFRNVFCSVRLFLNYSREPFTFSLLSSFEKEIILMMSLRHVCVCVCACVFVCVCLVSFPFKFKPTDRLSPPWI